MSITKFYCIVPVIEWHGEYCLSFPKNKESNFLAIERQQLVLQQMAKIIQMAVK